MGNSILSNVGNKNPADNSGENAKGTGDDERILASADCVGRVSLSNWQHIGTDKGTDLASGGGNTVVLTTDSGGTALGRDKTDVVARAKLTKGREDTTDVR